jgi:hypothetical protein
MSKPYDGTDKGADGVHVNPVRNETPVKGTEEVLKLAPSEYPIVVSRGVR